MSRSARRRHARSREPRGHWRLLALTLSVVFAALLFEGWTIYEVDAAKSRLPCTRPVPRAVDESGPVLRRISGDHAESSTVPARTVALTFDGGPDPYWTPRILDLLRKHHAHATFFLFGAQAAHHPEPVRRILDEGHEIGSNTCTGADLGSSSRVRAAMEPTLTQRTRGVRRLAGRRRSPGTGLRRRRVRPRPGAIEQDVLDLPGPDSTPEQALESLSTERALELVRGLPRDQAEAVLLRVVVGLDGPAAARVLGKRPGAVRTAAYRGLKRLARQLGVGSEAGEGVTDEASRT